MATSVDDAIKDKLHASKQVVSGCVLAISTVLVLTVKIVLTAIASVKKKRKSPDRHNRSN